MARNQSPQLIAGGNILPASFVKVSTAADTTALQAGAGEKTIGIVNKYPRTRPNIDSATAYHAIAGDDIELFGLGDICLLKIGTGGCTRGDYLKSDASGSGVTAGTGEFAGAIALQTRLVDEYALVQIIITYADVSAASSVADDVPLYFGTGSDAGALFSTGDASNHAFVIFADDTSQQIHITDKGARATDWNLSAGTHPEVYIHSNTTPATDYLMIGQHDGTSAVIDVGGGTTLSLKTSGTTQMSIVSTLVGIGDTSHAALTQGLVVNQGASDDLILALKSSDVTTALTTAVTGTVETDDYFTVQKFAATTGGAVLMALGENAAVTTNLRIESYGGQPETTHSTAGRSLIELMACQHDGANGLSNATADSNVLGIRTRVGGSEITVWSIDEDGAPQSVVDHATFDAYDDVSVIRSLDTVRSGGAYGLVKNRWDSYVQANEQQLIDMGILGCPMPKKPGDDRPLMNMKRLAMLHNGAIWQLYSEMMEIAAALPEESKEKLPSGIRAKLQGALPAN